MKKISLGSFPLIDVAGKDRKIFESYLIKVVSDLITSNQISNAIHSDRVQYITPLSILKFIKENKDGKLGQSNFTPSNDDQSDIRTRKAKVIRNAFSNTKSLYQAIAADPFYRTNMFYPIYIEEAVKASSGYTDYNYDFLILSNDLIKQQLIDEIIFDDKITMLFIVLKCLLMPEMRVTEIGTNVKDGENFRKYFSLFLETCKNENINPFDMFIKLIKAAGRQKRNNVPGALSRIQNRIMGNQGKPDASKLYHSKSFINLFNTEGEIKSASFLLNIPLSEINLFLKEDTKVDPNFNPMLRQYSQAKTHEYGKILSVIDALSTFNKSNNVVTELNSNSMQTQVPNTDLIINKDVIVGELETIYFRRFLEDLKKLEEKSILDIRSKLLKDFNDDLTKNNIVTKESLEADIAENNSNITKVARELKSAQDLALSFATKLGFGSFEDILTDPRLANTPAVQSKLNEINKNNLAYQQLQQLLAAQLSQVNKVPSQAGIDQTFKEKTLSLSVNLEIVQAQLTALYSEIYQYIYSESFESHIVTIKSMKPLNTTNVDSTIFNGKDKSADLNSAIMTISEIADSFAEELEINIKKEVQYSFKNQKALNYNFKANISNTINKDTIKDLILKNIFLPIFIKYTNKAISESNRLKDLKSDNNPILKKILSNKGMFKAYILNSETLISSYELLHYIDTIKYEEGIINHPVSRVNNDINKIDFMLKRMGLDNNPVFIFNKSHILLSMPSNLSLTGSNFISQVKTEEFVQFGAINWSQDLWNQKLMFGGPQNDTKYNDLKDSIEKIKIEIKSATEAVNKAQDKDKIKKEAALKKHQIDLKVKEEKLAKMKELMGANNFTSNVQSNKRSETPSTHVMNPNYGGRYNTNMDPQGYYPHERDIINNARDGMEHLRQQTTQNYPRPQQYQPEVPYRNPPGYGQQFRDNLNQQLNQPEPPQSNQYNHSQEQPEQQNDFMNNPYIQNRYHQLNRDQQGNPIQPPIYQN